MATGIAMHGGPRRFNRTLETLIENLAKHFADEEALLAQRGYARLEAHKLAHVGLLSRARELNVAARSA